MNGNVTPNAQSSRAAILIVDDRREKLLSYGAILEELGQDLFTASSGEQALKQVLERDFAVILLDVNMPGMNGIETAALIRKRARSAHVPIIFITADYSDEVTIARGYALGAVDFIASPIIPDILQAKVKVFVDLHLLAAQARQRAEEHIALAEERAARAAAEQATSRLSFLAQASVALAGSLDPMAITRELPALCVPFLADLCALTLSPENQAGAEVEVAWMSEDPRIGLLRRTVAGSGVRWIDDEVKRVLNTGRSAHFASAALNLAAPQQALRASHIGAAADFEIGALIVVPLLARGRTLGALLLGVRPAGHQFDADALAMVTDLAGRAAVALDNARLYAKIQDEDRRKDEFLAMLAHELRNPLAPISNAVHILQLSDREPGRREWAAEIISRQLKQLVRLVDDLLDVSRITRGKIELRLETIDAGKVIAAAVETSRPLIERYEHSLSIEVPPEPLSLKGDFARVEQILANLINNAAKYTNEGGRISLAARREGDEVVFRVRDTGIGIPPKLLSQIFEPFTQVDRSLARSQGGLGIGLTLVRRLTEMQGGRVFAFSEGLNCGSEFTVRLPAADAVPAAQRAPARAAETGTNMLPRARVLIVDDNRDVAESTAALIRLEGAEVHLAHDGEEALRMVRWLRPTAVLLDIGLPRMNGFEVAERIRSEPDLRDIVIIGISGYGQEEHRLRSKKAGFDHHIVKPIEPCALARLLASLHPSRASLASENVVSFPQRKAIE